MHLVKTHTWLIVMAASIVLFSCKKRDDDSGGGVPPKPTPYIFEIPDGFPDNTSLMPMDNQMTVEGIELGRQLFFEKKLSGDQSMSCASCHNPSFSFTDNGERFSTGIKGIAGTRNSMQLVNLAWARSFFWDGRRLTLEEQAHDPVVDPIEMHDSWPNVVRELKADTKYAYLFMRAFGTAEIDSIKVMKALAQFERSLVSSNSKLDLFIAGKYNFSPMERMGRDLFMQDRIVLRDTFGNITSVSPGADCFHCHTGTANPLLTDELFHNNGLDLIPTDSGLARVTKNPSDMGKFKTPSLRNISFTAPYMHDGRFATIDEVIDFYSEGLQHSPTIDPLMKNVSDGGIQLTPQQKQALKAFLLTFNDTTFVNDPAHQEPLP